MQWLEGINAVTVIFAALCVFAIGYRFYGLYIAQKVLNLNPNRETPAVKYADDRDYVKTDKFVLFGHHFAAIAAAGPLLGPVLAAQFGYLPGLLWILIGCVLAGGGRAFLLGASRRTVARVHRDEGSRSENRCGDKLGRDCHSDSHACGAFDCLRQRHA